jgi:DNA invertase Pin-like site-specific DNA recombinase
MMISDKIQATHLERTAFVYVRQSSLQQVRDHTEGQRQQYALVERARALGFRETVLIDEDQGRSGSGRHDRPGFGRLLTGVCQGSVGAVLALEASRLARNNRDWHHLVDLCALTDTLIIDAEGVYDARQLNDRLLLGLKGTMSEFELGLLRQRAREAFEQKAQRGHALWELPVGFVRTEEHRIEKIPDREVQQAIEGVFRKFIELGSARQTTLWYWDEELLLPHVIPGTAGREIAWRRPTAHRVNQILKNPCYAGAFAYGRTAAQTVVRDGRARQGNRRRKPQSQWKILILDAHPGYITWKDYLGNQRMLEENAAERGTAHRGAVKRGPALLAGLLRCGCCGRKVHVNYSGNTGRVPRYVCGGSRLERGSAPCLSAGGLRLDEAVVSEVLAVIQSVGVEAALLAVDQLANANDQKRESLALALERAQFEVRRAQRQYDAVDPDNRLVASELEHRWNEALERVAELEAKITALDDAVEPLTDEQRSSLMALGSDLSAAWDHPDTDVSLRKRILRTLLKEIVLNNVDDPPVHELRLHWQGGVHTQLRVLRNGRGQHGRATDADVVELVRELSKVAEDKTIAAILNRLGYKSGQGKSWHAHRVANLRYYHRLPKYDKRTDWLTLEQAATRLAVSNTVVHRLIKERTLPARQVVRYAPWIIEVADLELPAVQKAIRAVHEGRKLSRTHADQQEIPL